MSTGEQGGGLVGTLKEMAPALSGNPVAVWHAARVGTQRAADALPDAPGLDRVKGFARRHPLLTAGVATAAGYYLLGGRMLGGRLLARVV